MNEYGIENELIISILVHETEERRAETQLLHLFNVNFLHKSIKFSIFLCFVGMRNSSTISEKGSSTCQ